MELICVFLTTIVGIGILAEFFFYDKIAGKHYENLALWCLEIVFLLLLAGAVITWFMI